jgi:vacuolar-type H+-ATPase subunit I/STV1
MTALRTFVQRNASFILVAAATISLACFPATLCFDCEPDYTFGRPASLNDFGWDIFSFWLIAVSFAAGLLRLRFAWLLPLCVAIADVATQHLGGVPWWDVKNNEGPMILIFATPFGCMALTIGLFVRVMYEVLRNRLKGPSLLQSD